MADFMTGAMTLLASGSVSSSQNSGGTFLGTPIPLKVVPRGATFQLKIAAAPASSVSGGPSLDVYIQHSVDYLLAGPASSNFAATWDDLLHFTQATVAATAVGSIIAAVAFGAAPSSSVSMHAAVTNTLAAGQIRNGPTGGAWRVSGVVAGASVAGSSSAYSIAVYAQPFL